VPNDVSSAARFVVIEIPLRSRDSKPIASKELHLLYKVVFLETDE